MDTKGIIRSLMDLDSSDLYLVMGICTDVLLGRDDVCSEPELRRLIAEFSKKSLHQELSK